LQHNIGDDLTKKHSYILMRIKNLQGVKTITTSSHSLKDWRDLSLSLLSSPLISYTMKYTHTSQKATMARRWERGS
jgi:hypothetical protein